MMTDSDRFEKDQRIAKLLGWSWNDKVIRNRHSQWTRKTNGKDQLRDVIPDYHEYGNAMLSLIKAMEKRGYEWEFYSKEGSNVYEALFHSANHELGYSEAETIQEAVCNAAIKALEAEAINEATNTDA